MSFTRAELKMGLKSHMRQVEKSIYDFGSLLGNPEYRTAACLLSIMELQDAGVSDTGVSTVGGQLTTELVGPGTTGVSTVGQRLTLETVGKKEPDARKK